MIKNILRILFSLGKSRSLIESSLRKSLIFVENTLRKSLIFVENTLRKSHNIGKESSKFVRGEYGIQKKDH